MLHLVVTYFAATKSPVPGRDLPRKIIGESSGIIRGFDYTGFLEASLYDNRYIRCTTSGISANYVAWPSKANPRALTLSRRLSSMVILEATQLSPTATARLAGAARIRI